MPIKWKYRIWCEDEQQMVTVWADANATPSCPNNPSHAVSRFSAVETNENYEGEKNYCVKEYQGRRLVKETWYENDNGDDTYSQKVEEIVYNYNQNNLISTVTTTFWTDETPILSKTVEYFTNGNNIIVKNK
jgi:hypothetical protein